MSAFRVLTGKIAAYVLALWATLYAVFLVIIVKEFGYSLPDGMFDGLMQVIYFVICPIMVLTAISNAAYFFRVSREPAANRPMPRILWLGMIVIASLWGGFCALSLFGAGSRDFHSSAVVWKLLLLGGPSVLAVISIWAAAGVRRSCEKS